MKTYGRIDIGVLVEIIEPVTDADGNEIPIEQRFHPDFVATLVDITDLDPRPQEGWTYDGSTFEPPATQP